MDIKIDFDKYRVLVHKANKHATSEERIAWNRFRTELLELSRQVWQDLKYQDLRHEPPAYNLFKIIQEIPVLEE